MLPFLRIPLFFSKSLPDSKTLAIPCGPLVGCLRLLGGFSTKEYTSSFREPTFYFQEFQIIRKTENSNICSWLCWVCISPHWPLTLTCNLILLKSKKTYKKNNRKNHICICCVYDVGIQWINISDQPDVTWPWGSISRSKYRSKGHPL